MSIYVKVIDNLVEQYPYSLGDMLADNPTVSFAQPISLETAADFNTYLVEEIPQPAYDSITQNLIWTNPDFVGGVWVQTWAVEPATPEEIEQRLQQKRQAMIVTPFQAKVALLNAGVLDEVQALISAPTTDLKIVLAWSNVTRFERLSPMVAGIATALGWTDEELDDLFDAAAQIV
jgi:hypothetical protein